MAYIAVDTDFHKHPVEFIYLNKPERGVAVWETKEGSDPIPIPKGSIEKLIGKKLTWEDEPVELKEQE